MAAVGVEHGTKCLQGFGVCPVENVHAAAVGDDQAGPAQLGQVVADGAVAEVECCCQFAADLFAS